MKDGKTVRNKIDLTLPPETVFLNPWREGGVSLLSPLEFVWRPTEGAVIEGFAVSAHDEINRKIRSFVDTTKRHKTFTTPIEYNVVPALLNEASFRKSHVLAGDRLLLTGASGSRLINTYRWARNEASNEPETRPVDAINGYLAACRDANAGVELPIVRSVLAEDLHFAAECRNTFNYYHFITESLSQLTVLDDVDFRGNIYFHYPNSEDKQRPFAEGFVEALFPEYAGRVFFERVPKDYDRVLTAFDLRGAHAQMPQDPALARIVPGSVLEKFGTAGMEFQPILAMNSVPRSLRALRARALRAIEGHDFSYLPRRFFVGRDDRKSRARPVAGLDLLFEHLEMFGFEFVVFESLTPLEQIAIMAQAEVMISCHGAGFTNMLYAGSEACVIELGTLQTAQFRWADFWPVAHAAQCRYISFFADFNASDQLREPHFGTDGIVPVALSEAAVAQIMGFVVTFLGHTPEISSPEMLTLSVQRLKRADALVQAVALLDVHEEMVRADAELCLLKADCHKALNEPKSELVALDMAFKADTSRWQTLIRIIWCANRCDRPQVIRWARSRLERDFPERHDAFVSNHKWVRYVA